MRFTCGECGSTLKRAKTRLRPGVMVEAWVCPEHSDETYLDLTQYGDYYALIVRKVFTLGGSLAVRLPKKLADEAGIRDGTPLRFRRRGRRITIEPEDRGK